MCTLGTMPLSVLARAPTVLGFPGLHLHGLTLTSLQMVSKMPRGQMVRQADLLAVLRQGRL